MSQIKADEAFSKLERLGNQEEAIAILDKIVEQRKRKTFVKFFEPWLEQKDAIRKFDRTKKIFGLLGGNRSGKTVLGAFIAVAWCLGKEYFRDEPAWEWVKDLPIPEPPNNVWVVGVTNNVLRDVIWYEKLRHGKSHPAFLPTDGTIRDCKDGDFQVFFENGSLLTGKSAEAGRDKFQGASIDLVWLDEECEQNIFDECYQRTVDCAGRILLTLTPLTDINSGVRTPWVFDLYEEFLAGDSDLVFCQLSTLNSPFVPEDEKKKLIDKWAGDPEEGARLYGKFVRRSGLVYPWWDKNKHIIRPFPIPRFWQRIVSIDPAATGITAAIWIAVDEQGNYYAYREYYERDRIVSEHAKGIDMRRQGEPVDYWLLDPKWGSQRAAENHKNGAQLYREAGIPVRLPEVGEDYGLAVSKEYISATVTPGARHPKFYVMGDLPNFEHEITHYTYDSWAKGEMKGLSKEKPRKRNDHLLNATQYAMCLRLKGSKKRSTDIFGNIEQDKQTVEQRQRNRSYT